jgi:hypothetical protein
MTRSVSVAVLLVVLAAGGVARGDDTMPTGPLASGAKITFSELKIHENNNTNLDFPKVDPDSTLHYFNLAHCQCAQAKPADFNEGSFAYLLKLEGANGAPVGRPLEVYVGSNCMPDAARPPSTTATCHRIDSAGATSVDTLVNPGNFRPEIPIFDFMTPTPGATACVPASQSNTLWAAVDTNMNGLLDYFLPQSLPTDSLAPPLPLMGSFRASGVENGVQISWSPPSDTSDVFAYQALCARADDGSPGRTSGQPPPRYMTATTLCGLPKSLTLMPVAIPTQSDAPDAGASIMLPSDMANLDSTFVCGEVISPTANGLRIDGLQNGVAYKIAVLVEDKYQNVNGVYFTSTVTPIPSRDFWQDLHDRGSQTEGGLCLLAETYGDDSGLTGALRAFRDDTLGASRAGRWLSRAYYATLARLGAHVHDSIALRALAAVALAPAVALALLWHWLTLPGLLGLIAAAVVWRRWRSGLPRRAARLLRPRTVAPVVASMLALITGRAHAGGYRPYWEDNDSFDQKPLTATDDVTGDVTWHVGVRIGPYVPDIDGQLGGSTPGPYEQMFGGDHILTMLDVDRIVWSGFGQVAVGLSAGYWQKTASTFTIDSMSSQNPRPRAADHNAFRLVPTELSATYRFTWLDDNYGVPLVPYARAGLGYYIWWVSVAGHYAHACSNPTTSVFCNDGQSHNDKALGASLGLQGAIGLAIRAERIDASAAMSMQQSGIQHAGIYAELSLAKIDGFGSDKKLSVGDRTWFAGVDFEF